MRWIVLLRAVNVSGHGKTPMAELRTHLAAAGAQNVTSYIQSGNLVFDHPDADATSIANWTSDLIETHFGHRPPAVAFTAAELQRILDANPFPDADPPKFLHFHLFKGDPAGDAIDRLQPDLTEGEEIELGQNCLYHWPPQGFGKSKIAQKIPRALGTTTTSRNLNSIRSILALA